MVQGFINSAMKYSFLVNPEQLTDGEFDAWTTDTNLTSWTEDGVAASRVISKESTEKHSGNYAAKIVNTASDGTTDVGIYQDVASLEAGDYIASVWCKFSSKTAGYVLLEAYNTTDGAVLASALVQTESPWQELNVRFTLAATKTVRIKCYLMDETAGTVYLDLVSLKIFSSTNFDATKHAIIRSCATDYSAYLSILYDVDQFPTIETVETTLNGLWVSWATALCLLSDPRLVDYLKSL